MPRLVDSFVSFAVLFAFSSGCAGGAPTTNSARTDLTMPTVVEEVERLKRERPVVSGFTWLRAETSASGGQTHTVQIYKYDAFMRAGATGPASEFVLVPAGSFSMGTPAGEEGNQGDEGPVRRVTFANPFLLARTEVTQIVWKGLVGNTGLNEMPSRFNGDNLPVEKVSWEDSVNWCRSNGLRLPSEAEWEYACRAGTTSRFSFDDGDVDLGSTAWHSINSGSATHYVGGKRKNAFALFDMHGNVWEWCQDDYKDDYQGAPTNGTAVPNAGASDRVVRGGSWSSMAVFCRSASRLWNPPDDRDGSLGFRPAKSVD